MVQHRPLALLLLPLLCLPLSQVAAQHQAGTINVNLTYPDDRPVGAQLRVRLMSGSGGDQVGETFTNDRGQATFLNVAVGNYRVSVNGEGIEPKESEPFQVDSWRVTQSVLITVMPAKDNRDANAAKGGGMTVSASDLRVPKKASQEFDKATKLIVKQEWQKAIDQLNKAIALYPAYAQAYNNLGVVYARLGDPAKEREALQKAIAANDHFAPALVNLARMEMKQQDFAAAEAHLNQATAADPTDAPTLVLLAQTQLLDHHYEDAIASATKVHAISHGSYAVVHYVAARAWEKLNRLSDAVRELKVFLTEEPSGERATAARQEMAEIQTQLP